MMRIKPSLVIPVALIVLAEALFFNGMTEACLEVHLLNVFICVMLAIYMQGSADLLMAFIMVSLLRVLNVGMPTFFDLSIYYYPFIYLPVIFAAYIIWRADNVEDGKPINIRYLWSFINGDKIDQRSSFRWIFVPIAIGIGLVMSFFEYAVLKPDVLVPDMGLISLASLLVVMVFFVGFGEELVFRALLQRRVQERCGAVFAIVFSAFIFSMMHSGYESLTYLVYVFGVALVLGGLFFKTKNLLLVALIHGFINFFLFSFLPNGWFFFD